MGSSLPRRSSGTEEVSPQRRPRDGVHRASTSPVPELGAAVTCEGESAQYKGESAQYKGESAQYKGESAQFPRSGQILPHAVRIPTHRRA